MVGNWHSAFSTRPVCYSAILCLLAILIAYPITLTILSGGGTRAQFSAGDRSRRTLCFALPAVTQLWEQIAERWLRANFFGEPLQLLHRHGFYPHAVTVQHQRALLSQMPGIENVGFAEV